MVTDATREDDSFAIRSQPQHSTRRAAAPQKAVNSQLFPVVREHSPWR